MLAIFSPGCPVGNSLKSLLGDYVVLFDSDMTEKRFKIVLNKVVDNIQLASPEDSRLICILYLVKQTGLKFLI